LLQVSPEVRCVRMSFTEDLGSPMLANTYEPKKMINGGD
jgi:hypothetical protein